MRNIPDWAHDVRAKLDVYEIQQCEIAEKVGLTRETVNRLLLGVVPCSEANRNAIQTALETIIKERGE